VAKTVRVIPVFEAERQFEQQHGWKPLFRKLEEKQIPLYVDLNRSSAV